MSSSTQHLVISNFMRIHRAYFDDEIVPIVKTIKQLQIPIIKQYLIANKQIRLNVYSSSLAKKFSQALSHLEIKSLSTPDLTVELWDSVSTQTTLKSPFEHTDHQNELETQTNESITDGFYGIFLSGEQTLNIFDKTTRTAYFWTRDANLLPDWLSASPLRTILHWFLSLSNTHLIHGAVVGMEDKAILLSAKGGSGKSTTAISSVLSGMDYLGDDYVAIESKNKIIAHSLYNSAKVDEKTIRQFPTLTQHISNPQHKPEDKAIVFISELFPEQVVKRANLTAIMIPHIVTNSETRIIPATKLQAMLALTPTTLFQLPLAHNTKLSELKSIIEQTPCYILELGLPVTDVPNVLKTFLETQSNSPS